MPDNFRFPYAAVGFSDFWRRWHITLSSWLRDYLYIPLGGNRFGPARTYTALMGTMLLGGLWHGAAWTFVVWGGLHGLYLAVERWLKGAFRELAAGPRRDRRARPADLCAGQHHLGVLPRQGLHRCVERPAVDGRRGGQAGADDRASADDLRDGDRRRDRRHALGDARQDAGDRGRADAGLAGRRRCSGSWESRSSRNRGKAVPSSTSSSEPRAQGASSSAKARSPRACA